MWEPHAPLFASFGRKGQERSIRQDGQPCCRINREQMVVINLHTLPSHHITHPIYTCSNSTLCTNANIQGCEFIHINFQPYFYVCLASCYCSIFCHTRVLQNSAKVTLLDISMRQHCLQLHLNGHFFFLGGKTPFRPIMTWYPLKKLIKAI